MIPNSSHASEPEHYDALRVYLVGLPKHQFSVRLTFKDIEAILGHALPEVAYTSIEWWKQDSTSPQARAWLNAGFEWEVVAHGSDGWVGFARGVQRWPGLVVDSKKFGQKPAHERLRQLALAYVQSAKLLCAALGEQPAECSWPRGSVACFCYRHAIELFLKSCILYRTPVIDKCSHDISALRREYIRLYPHDEFHFATPFDISLDDLDELLGVEVALVEDFERKSDQVYRYLSDKQGRSPLRVYVFAPGSWLSLCERLELDISRIWARIEELETGR